MGSNVSVHCYVDSTIDRHGELHVVRVGVDGILIPTEHVEVLFETLVTPVLSKYLEVELGTTISSSAMH